MDSKISQIAFTLLIFYTNLDMRVRRSRKLPLRHFMYCNFLNSGADPGRYGYELFSQICITYLRYESRIRFCIFFISGISYYDLKFPFIKSYVSAM